MTKTLARALSLGLVLAVVTVSAADARPRHRSKAKIASDSRIIAMLQRVLADNEKLRIAAARMGDELIEIKQRLRPDVVASIELKPDELPAPPSLAAPMPIPDATKTLRGYEHHIARSTKLKDLTPKLAMKVSEVLAACPGSRLTSGYRRGARVAGSGRSSLHSHYPSRAADMAGNPSCIRRLMAGWPGGLSTDYAAVRHYHFSYAPGGREWGARFAHYRGSRGSHRVARHDRHQAPRYARSIEQTVASAYHTPQ